MSSNQISGRTLQTATSSEKNRTWVEPTNNHSASGPASMPMYVYIFCQRSLHVNIVLKVSAPIFQLRWGDLFKTSHVTAGPTWQERKTRTRHHKDDHPLTQFPESHMRTPPWVNHAGNTQPPGRPPRKGQYPMPVHPYNLPDTGVHPTPATGTVKCG